MFVGVLLPAEVLEHLAAALEPLRENPAAPHWTSPTRWHLTLTFLGEVGAERSAEFAEEFAALPPEPPYRLSLRGAGSFDGANGPVVLWTGLAGQIDALRAATKRVRSAAHRVGITPDGKPQTPHVTLGRWRGSHPRARQVVEALAQYEGPEFVVSGASLIRSYLGPNARYEELSRSGGGDRPASLPPPADHQA